MSEQFTKADVGQYLGKVFQFTKDYDANDDGYQDAIVKSGEVGKITGIDFHNNQIRLNLDVYGNFYLLDKQAFSTHCQLLFANVQPAVTGDILS